MSYGADAVTNERGAEGHRATKVPLRDTNPYCPFSLSSRFTCSRPFADAFRLSSSISVSKGSSRQRRSLLAGPLAFKGKAFEASRLDL
eukprot:symbB.v1.2.037594.t1/scaffold5596.1/size25502/1